MATPGESSGVAPGSFPPAAPATTLAGLVALATTFAAVIRAETLALRKGERESFEAFTACKADYAEILKQSMEALAPQREKASAKERADWAAIAADCEAALQENAKLIAGEQLHAAAMMDMLRQTFRQRPSNSAGYGRDGRLKPRT